MKILTIATCILLALAAQVESDPRDPMEALSILALGALDGRAVVKTPDNKMHVLKLGSVIPGTKATVTQILADKLIVEDKVDVSGGSQSQTVWISKGGADGKAIVQRLTMEAPVVMAAPQSTLVSKVVEVEGKKVKKKKAD